jgi:NAD-dependent dihydropyrimidine dehydrogenase PreA subunit
MTQLTYISGVTTLELDPTRCNGCRICMTVCPHPVFAPLKGAVEIRDRDLCMECGACVMNCPEGALAVNPGVGCATAILASWITRSDRTCGASSPHLDSDGSRAAIGDETEQTHRTGLPGL